MAYIDSGINCCGIGELANIRESDSAEEAIMEVYEHRHDQGIVLFSEAKDRPDWRGIGKDIQQFIKKHNLGTVVALPATKNPNTGRMIRAYLWRVNQGNLRTWGDKYVKAHPDRYDTDDNYYNPWGEPY